MSTIVAGSQVTAAFISPACRKTRGNEGAWDEAVARLKAEYDLVVEGWKDHEQQPTLNLILTMERPWKPAKPGDACQVRDAGSWDAEESP